MSLFLFYVRIQLRGPLEILQTKTYRICISLSPRPKVSNLFKQNAATLLIMQSGLKGSDQRRLAVPETHRLYLLRFVFLYSNVV